MVIYPSKTRDNDRVAGVDFRCHVTIMTGYVGGISDELKLSNQPYKTAIF